jgi:hypothetical protein
VPYFVNPANADVSEDAAIAALQAAAANWSEQTAANVRLYYAGRTTGGTLASNGINEVFFRGTTDGTKAAVTYYWRNSANDIIDADMVIYDGAYRFYSGQSGCSGSGIYIEDVATHEFGHFLGLNHSTNSAATMYPSMPTFCTLSWRELATDDIAGIEALYPQEVAPPVETPPASPANLAASAGSASVTLNWIDQANNEQGVAIERSANGGAFGPLTQVPANTTAFSDSSAAPSTTYSYRARSWNGTGYSNYSNVATLTTPAPPAPPAAPSTPSSPSPSAGAEVNGNPTLAWTASQATSYDVYFGTSTNPPFKGSVSSPSMGAGKLTAGSTYYWRVVARNATGQTSGPVWSFKAAKKGGGKR